MWESLGPCLVLSFAIFAVAESNFNEYEVSKPDLILWIITIKKDKRLLKKCPLENDLQLIKNPQFWSNFYETVKNTHSSWAGNFDQVS